MEQIEPVSPQENARHQQKQLKRKLNIRKRWLAAGMFCFALFTVLSFFPAFTEKYYSRGVYVPVRYFFDYTIGLTSLPASFLFSGLVLAYVIWKTYRFIWFNIKNKSLSWSYRIGYLLLSFGSFAGKVSVVFFLSWGFHFWRTPFEQIAGIEVLPLNPQEILVQANWERKRADEARAQIQGLGYRPFHAGVLPDPMMLEDEMREHMNTVMTYLGYPTYPGIRCKYVGNDLFLNLIGYTGVYISFFGEAQVNAKIPPVYLPFYIAHEMAHAYGFFDEATANFLAYMACEQSENPAIRYSGRVSHLLYLWHELEFMNLDFPTAVLLDLRSSGALGGETWYNRMILLVHGWRKVHPFKLS